MISNLDSVPKFSANQQGELKKTFSKISKTFFNSYVHSTFMCINTENLLHARQYSKN